MLFQHPDAPLCKRAEPLHEAPGSGQVALLVRLRLVHVRDQQESQRRFRRQQRTCERFDLVVMSFGETENLTRSGGLVAQEARHIQPCERELALGGKPVPDLFGEAGRLLGG